MLDQDILEELGVDSVSEIPQEDLQDVLDEYNQKSTPDSDTKSTADKIREQDNYIDETENFWVLDIDGNNDKNDNRTEFKCRSCGRSTPTPDFLSHEKPNSHFGTCNLGDTL